MSVVEELADLLAEDGGYEVYTGPESNHIDLYRYACHDCEIPFDVIFIEGNFVVWGENQYRLDHTKTGLEDIADAILCTMKKSQNSA